MINRGIFAGKTVLVTGSSRGIGKAIALKFARDGANVVVAAKTVDPHPKLEGTILDTAKEVESCGGKSLAVQLDIRDEETVKSAIDKTIQRFGGLDVVVNNASAIFIAPSEDTPMKRFDLMNSINVRGTFMVSKYAIPHLKKAQNPHIINLSPPIELKDQWFSQSTAYTMSKYGMSLSAFGMAAELKGQVGVNALWPKTAIWTAAMSMLGGDEAKNGSRKPSIMADAAYAIASKDSKSVTGNFYIDEELLRTEGVTDFEQYAEAPGSTLLPDFFLPERVLKDFDTKLLDQLMAKQTPSASGMDSPQPSTPTADGPVASVFASTSSAMTDEIKNDLNSVLHFVIAGKSWTLVCKRDEPFQVYNREPEGKCDVTMTTDDATFIKMAKGEVKPTSAFMGGKLKVKGSMGIALKVEKLFGKLKSKL